MKVLLRARIKLLIAMLSLLKIRRRTIRKSSRRALQIRLSLLSKMRQRLWKLSQML